MGSWIALLLLSGLLLREWPRRGLWIGRYRTFRGHRTPRFPVVLAHGLCGFDEIELAGQRHTYFRGIAERLREQGVSVHVARVDPSASIARRAAQLAEQVRKIPARKVNIIAHSMGGLDARYAIAKLGLAPRVASLITIGTPHRGTPLADHGVSIFGDRLGLKSLCRYLGVEIGAFDNLTTTHLTEFNQEVLDHEHVYYASVVGRAGKSELVHPTMYPIARVMRTWSGENDGLVPVSSQAWGEVVLEIEACHLAQIGWVSNFDPQEIFQPLMRDLTRRGC